MSVFLTTTAGASPVPQVASYSGPGFDLCSAPSAAELKAWSSSPFGALNIYIGGVNRACSQPNLSATWVKTVIARWRLIPTYVGLQAPDETCGCAAITPSKAYAEGVAAADSAVSEAAALGIGAGNPIYDDMEGYQVHSADTTAVLNFVEGWTRGLAAKNYDSGFYSNANSGIANLVATVGTSYTEPDDIWIADWNDEETTSDPYVPAGDWSDHQRIHQYRGPHDASYGGVTLNFDSDDCNGAVVTSASL
jgi:hypothetical protein